MPTLELTDYEAAYSRVEHQLELERDWGRLESLVRRRLRQPSWSLWGTVALIVLAAGSSFVGVGNGWMVALGLCLAVLPGRLEAVKRRRRELAAVESAADVRALVHQEARKRMAGAFVGSLLMGVLGLLYLLVGGVAWLLDKSPWPGVIAGLIVLAWSAVQLVVLLPRATREVTLFSDPDAGPEDDDGDD
jgi:hypothetical protein